MSDLDRMDQVMKAAILVGAAKQLPKGSDKQLEFLAAAQDLLGPETAPASPPPSALKS